MTEPSQYFKGRTVQEQMNEVIGYVDTRAAEVATTAIASDVAQVHQDMLDADADAQAAAASAAAAAGTLANAVKKTGEASQSIAGDIAVAGTLSGGTVTVPTPVNNTDAASKKYVDDYHDATKLNITDVNSYAVGLTGNQSNVSGNKTFLNMIKIFVADSIGFNKTVSNFDHSSRPASNMVMRLFQLNDNQERYIFRLNVICYSDGRTSLQCEGYVIDDQGNRVYKNAVIAVLTP